MTNKNLINNQPLENTRRAKEACKNSGLDPADHFAETAIWSILAPALRISALTTSVSEYRAPAYQNTDV